MEKESAWLLRDKYGGICSPEYKKDLDRLRLGEPVAYVIGWVPFCGTTIWLDSRPLIPRDETEFWTLEVIRDIRRTFSEPVQVLDLCAGSGCVGISILKAFPDARADFVELDEVHHKTLWKNIEANAISFDRVRVLGGSLFEKVDGRYDVIVTNPPYINPDLSSRVDASVLDFEPHKALFGGKGGTELLGEIAKEAPRFLKPGGMLYVEHEPEQEVFVKESLPGSTSHKDQFGLVRFSVYRS